MMFDWLRRKLIGDPKDLIWQGILGVMEDDDMRKDIRAMMTEEVDFQWKRIMGRIGGSVSRSGGLLGQMGLSQGIDLKALTKNPFSVILYMLMNKGLSTSPSSSGSGDFEVGT